MNACIPVVDEFTTNQSVLPLVLNRAGDVCIDSRSLASMLNIENRVILRNIDCYLSKFEAFGVVTFETEKLPADLKGGRPVRYVLLNEDQAYFAVLLSGNTAQVVCAKCELLKAFSEARKSQQTKQGQYLPFLHVAHDTGRKMVEGAKAEDREVSERIGHVSIERLINKAFGIEAGQREGLSVSELHSVGMAYQIASDEISDLRSYGYTEDEAYQEAVREVEDFLELFAPVPAEEVQG